MKNPNIENSSELSERKECGCTKDVTVKRNQTKKKEKYKTPS